MFDELPDEVLFEMMDGVEDEDVVLNYLNNVRTTKCKKCGYSKLRWNEFQSGWMLVYTDGPAKGKVHGCDLR